MQNKEGQEERLQKNEFRKLKKGKRKRRLEEHV